MKKNKGFTLIELLVVIAIIGILASVVLASLGTARTRAADGRIQSQLSGMRAQAELYSGTPSLQGISPCVATSGSLFDTANNGFGGLLAGITLTGSQCNSTATLPSNGGQWAVAVPTSAGAWCVDYTGQAKGTQGSGTSPYTAATGGATAALLNGTDYVCN